MATEEENRKVIIRGHVFLYRQKAPFSTSGESILGALEYDAANDKVRCHECGGWYKSVGAHAAQKHHITAKKYKATHGLRSSSALCGESTRTLLIEHAAGNKEFAVARESWGSAKGRDAALLARKSNSPKVSVETRNLENRCHAQLLFRLQTLAASLGHTPTVDELEHAGIGHGSLCLSFNLPSITEVMSLIGLQPNPPGHGLKYSRLQLIEIMRDFYVKNKRLPARSDYQRGLVPVMRIFVNEFGSMANCYETVGLSAVARLRTSWASPETEKGRQQRERLAHAQRKAWLARRAFGSGHTTRPEVAL